MAPGAKRTRVTVEDSSPAPPPKNAKGRDPPLIEWKADVYLRDRKSKKVAKQSFRLDLMRANRPSRCDIAIEAQKWLAMEYERDPTVESVKYHLGIDPKPKSVRGGTITREVRAFEHESQTKDYTSKCPDDQSQLTDNNVPCSQEETLVDESTEEK